MSVALERQRDRDMVDALRVVLGMQPLYREASKSPTYLPFLDGTRQQGEPNVEHNMRNDWRGNNLAVLARGPWAKPGRRRG